MNSKIILVTILSAVACISYGASTCQSDRLKELAIQKKLAAEISAADESRTMFEKMKKDQESYFQKCQKPGAGSSCNPMTTQMIQVQLFEAENKISRHEQIIKSYQGEMDDLNARLKKCPKQLK